MTPGRVERRNQWRKVGSDRRRVVESRNHINIDDRGRDRQRNQRGQNRRRNAIDQDLRQEDSDVREVDHRARNRNVDLGRLDGDENF